MTPKPAAATSTTAPFSAHAERLVTILQRAIETINLVKTFPSLWLDVFQGRTGQVEHFLGPLSTMHLIHLGKLAGFHPSHGHQGDYHRETRAWKYCPEEQQHHNTIPSSSKSTLDSPPSVHSKKVKALQQSKFLPPAHHYQTEEDPRIFIEPHKKLLVTKLMNAHPSDFDFLTDLLGLHMGRNVDSSNPPPFSLVKLLKEALKSRYGDHVKKALVEKDVKSLSCILSLILSSAAASDSSEIRVLLGPNTTTTTEQHLTWLMDQMWQKQQQHQSLNRIQKVDSKCGKQSENVQMDKPDSTFPAVPKGNGTRLIKRPESDHTITNTPPQRQPTLSRQSIGDNSIWELHQQPDQQNATHYSLWPKQTSDGEQDQDSSHSDNSLDSEILAILKEHETQKPDPIQLDFSGRIQEAAEQNNSLDNLQSTIFDASTASSEEKTDWKSEKQESYSQQNSLTTRRPTLADLPITPVSEDARLSLTASPSRNTTKESSSVSPSSCDETIQSIDLSETEKQHVTKIFSILLPAIRNNAPLRAWMLQMDSLDLAIASDVDQEEEVVFEGLENFQSILEELVELVNAKLEITLTNEMRTANMLRETWKRLFRWTRKLEKFKREHIEMKKAARPRLLSLDFQVKLLQSRLSQVSQVNHDLIKKEIRETELVAAIQEKAEVLRRESAYKSLQVVQRQSEVLKSEIQERQKQLLAQRNALYEQLRQQIAMYDQRMFEMQQKLDDTIEERRTGARSLERCQAEYAMIQNKYTDMMAEKKLRQILRNAQAASEMKRNKAASVIQATWRKYRIRKRKKERKRAKKTAAAAKRKQAKAAKK